MDFYIKYSESDILRLPVNPSDFTIQQGNNTQTVNVTNVGELSLWGPEKLRAVSIASFFPYRYSKSYCNYSELKKPWDCVALINKWRNTGKPVRLVILDKDKNVDINIEMLIETIDTTMQDASGDVYYTLAFREYKRVQINTTTNELSTARPAPSTSTSNNSSNNTSTQRTYTVVKGDCLWNIAKKYYGDGSKYMTIYNANKSTIGNNPNLIKPGQKLIIP